MLCYAIKNLFFYTIISNIILFSSTSLGKRIMLKKILRLTLKNRFSLLLMDIILSPLIFISAWILLLIRRIGLQHFKLCKAILLAIGIIPIRNHYYEPFINTKNLRKPLSDNRTLPGIDWNIKEQLLLLNQFVFGHEISDISDTYINDITFHFNNHEFEAGDAEFWYHMIRVKKPRTIIEIGSGHSTKMAQLAIQRNKSENNEYHCKHICIEPYNIPWLEQLDITVMREKVEKINLDLFKTLGANDILFIDSSHVIRPQGDVLYEYLEILPMLKNGVIVHIHDIFSPKDYPKELLIDMVQLWNEQYLLEAFLTHNHTWKIIGAVNYLHHHHFNELKKTCPKLSLERESVSFYIEKQA